MDQRAHSNRKLRFQGFCRSIRAIERVFWSFYSTVRSDRHSRLAFLWPYNLLSDKVLRSCTSTLRIIRSTQKPATMPPLHYHLRGHRHGTNPLFLRTRARCSGVDIPHALLAVAERLRCPSPADRTIQATPTQAIQSTQTVCRTNSEALIAPCVSTKPRILTRRLRRHPIRCPQPIDVPAGSIPHRHFCPHTGCRYRGWLRLGNLRANGHPSGGPWRQFQCTACQGYFPEHHGTIFHGKQVGVELILRVLACLAEGLGIRATARVFEVAPNTVLRWLVEAAEHLPRLDKPLSM